MAYYRLYRINDLNHIVSVIECEAADDLTALDEARNYCGNCEVEIWERSRLVARLAKDGSASKEPDSQSPKQ